MLVPKKQTSKNPTLYVKGDIKYRSLPGPSFQSGDEGLQLGACDLKTRKVSDLIARRRHLEGHETSSRSLNVVGIMRLVDSVADVGRRRAWAARRRAVTLLCIARGRQKKSSTDYCGF